MPPIISAPASTQGFVQILVKTDFSVALELIDDLRTKECHDLFMNGVTAAVVDA
jgi:hypothetical protein